VIFVKKENVVYLLVGQRGAGKSYYANKLIRNNPKLTLVSRDEILVRLFGSVHRNSYMGDHHLAENEMHLLLKSGLAKQTDIRLILDTWTGEGLERNILINKLRKYGAKKVIALYFITSPDVVNLWFWEKPGIAKAEEWEEKKNEDLVFFPEDTPLHDYKLFHLLASDIDSIGFDRVIRVNPQEELISLD
jgi:hypothetical protein